MVPVSYTHLDVYKRQFGIRSIDDSREGVLRFLKRNPTTSVVAVEDGKIVGAIPVSYTHLDVYKRQASRQQSGLAYQVES